MFNHLAELTLSHLGHMPQIVPRQADIFAFLVSEFNPLLEGITECATAHTAFEATFDWVYNKTTEWTIAASDMIVPVSSI